ncbi:hypothetical protein CANCADRAFT_1273 [Tortispora caseinolytica NRRL Y-17796]|uniref:DNA helicase n=1 Tax=Tortispora caseinolytica NRRL Y-17796 TaxID=767744 RepID=A0A1E4TM08_9ASCO|nr:hypothetical protein CANCADRAFT_1273 [Tortispora caseinolytica NRRL Y-17796]
MDSDDEDTKEFQTYKDALLFALDVSGHMSLVALDALSACLTVLIERLVNSATSPFGLVLFGTKSATNMNYPSCYTLIDLKKPTVEDVKTLTDLIHSPAALSELIGDGPAPLVADVFSFLIQKFLTNSTDNMFRKLVWITCNDDPYNSLTASPNDAYAIANDFKGHNIQFSPIFLSRPDHSFDSSIFYDVVLVNNIAPDQDPELMLGDIEDLPSFVISFKDPKRATFRVPLEIADGVEIALRGYSLIRSHTNIRERNVYIKGENFQSVITSRQWFSQLTSKVLSPNDLVYAYKFGPTQLVEFTSSEIKSIRNFGQSHIKILGFKPLRDLPWEFNIKNPILLYPDEETISGSFRTYAALHKSMLNSQTCALCYTLLRSGRPVFSAMIAHDEFRSKAEKDKGPPLHPAGLSLITLPYADDLRDEPEVLRQPQPQQTAIEFAKQFIELLTMKDGLDLSRYRDVYAEFYNDFLLAIALEDPTPVMAPDGSIPKYKSITSIAGEQIQKFNIGP